MPAWKFKKIYSYMFHLREDMRLDIDLTWNSLYSSWILRMTLRRYLRKTRAILVSYQPHMRKMCLHEIFIPAWASCRKHILEEDLPEKAGHTALQQLIGPSCRYWPMESSIKNSGIPQRNRNNMYGKRNAPKKERHLLLHGCKRQFATLPHSQMCLNQTSQEVWDSAKFL